MKSAVNKVADLFRTSLDRSRSRKVDFVVCGTQKGGTTALDAYLREHSQVCMAESKEVHFFDDESNFASLEPDYSRYHAAFAPEQSHRMLGEATPIYMYWHDAPRRIWEYNPNMKMIAVLRNPIERAYSHWNMERSRGAETLTFWDALHAEESRCKEELPLQHRVYSYVDRGFYSEQLRRIWRYFSRDAVLVLKNEYLRDSPEKCLEDVCDFLGIDSFSGIIPKEVHARHYPETMGSREREYLCSVFEYEIRSIERALGWNCTDWLS